MPNNFQNDPVAILRSQVDLSPYSFAAGSPRWLLALGHYPTSCRANAVLDYA